MHPPEASREHLKWPTLLKCRSRAVFLHSPRSFQRASEVAHVAKVPFARRIINIYWFRPCFVLRGLIFSCVFDTSVSKVMVPLSSSEWVLLGVLIFIWFRQRFWRFGGKWVLMQPLGVDQWSQSLQGAGGREKRAVADAGYHQRPPKRPI